MRTYIFGFEQSEAVKQGLGVRELLIMDYLYNFIQSGSMNYKIISDKKFYLIVYKKVLQDLPILGIKERQLQNIFHLLAEKKILSTTDECSYYLYININKWLLCRKNISESGNFLPLYNKLNYIKIKYKNNITKRVQPSGKFEFMKLFRKTISEYTSAVTFDLWFKTDEVFKLENVDGEGITFFIKNEKVYSLHQSRIEKAFDESLEKYARGEVL